MRETMSLMDVPTFTVWLEAEKDEGLELIELEEPTLRQIEESETTYRSDQLAFQHPELEMSRNSFKKSRHQIQTSFLALKNQFSKLVFLYEEEEPQRAAMVFKIMDALREFENYWDKLIQGW